MLRKDFSPEQDTLFTDKDIGQQGGTSINGQGKIALIPNHYAGPQPGSMFVNDAAFRYGEVRSEADW